MVVAGWGKAQSAQAPDCGAAGALKVPEHAWKACWKTKNCLLGLLSRYQRSSQQCSAVLPHTASGST